MRTHSIKQMQGFTLIELMIVVAIIAVLATIGMPMYNNYTIRSNVVAAIAEASSYKTAVALCYQENGALSSCDAGNDGVPSAASKITGITDGKITLNPQVDCDNDSSTDNTFAYSPDVDTGGIMTWNIADDQSNCGQYQ
ncbi:pilin [Vibrio panuliri]|uniref:Prepilin-type N-terminal cleavage/methylation domain-containing protein n=1 Tax=Vibrio panuliri TaxID=1381081 RepID=A0A1Q9HLB9_9VIBR|nr:prepilin-type N-terminal cleavage/methylation domain-containing protein [Vibrio panuliri]KAB1459730.1 prepilin-type N-terminal cleavage/methylation domain-containing protein [Vibrio panuliri]OLQ90054.1 hypothetical protein BIY20_10735 [Vibrio panuliri]OLQ91254.1 hypothetical protein BIY22_18150 [Vibrio panuliri]